MFLTGVAVVIGPAAPVGLAADEKRLGQAIEMVRDGDYSHGETALRELIREDPNSSMAHLYLALAMLRQELAAGEPSMWGKGPSRSGMRDIEQSATQALALNDRLVAARLARGVARAWLEEWRGAEADLQAALSGLEREPNKIASDYLQLATKAIKPWSIAVNTGLGYDTNVPQVGQGVAMPRWIGGARDFFCGTGADFTYRPYVGDRSEVGIGGGASGSWHCDLDLFDEQRYRGFAFARHRATDWLDVGIRYDYDYDLLGREDYLSQHRVMPQVSILEDFWGRTTAFYQYEPRRFFDNPAVLSTGAFDQTGDVQSVGVSQAVVLGKLWKNDKRDVVFEVGYRHEDISTRGTEYASRNEVLSAGLKVPLPWDLTFEFGPEWSFQDYKHRSVLDSAGRGREDFVQTYLFALTKRFNDTVSLRGQILWIDDDSNVLTKDCEAVYSYDRVVYGVTLMMSF